MSVDLTALAAKVTDALLAGGGQFKGSEIYFRCPRSGHEDLHPSARWNPSKGTYFCDPCDKGGGTLDLARLLRIEATNGNGASTTARNPNAPTAVYPYLNEAGEPAFWVCRFEKPNGESKPEKTFLQCHPCPRGVRGKTWNLGGNRRRCDCPRIRPVLFNLPDLCDPVRQVEPVFIVEGEKCASYLSETGLVATTSPGGAGKWKPNAAGIELAKPLVGRRVIILPDNDDAGRQHAENVARTVLKAGAAEVRMLELPSLPPKGDVVDWMLATKDQDKIRTIRRLADAAPKWSPTESTESKNPTSELLGDERFTDTGNAKRLTAQHGLNLRYCSKWKKWLAWDGKRWELDSRDSVMLRAMDTAKSIYREAAESKDPEDSERLAKHANHSLSESALRAMVNLARSFLPVKPSAFDQHPWLLNFLNGALDLRTGAICEHRREDLLTTLALVEFDAEAASPTWVAFLQRIFAGNEALISFVQRAVGSSLPGVIRDQVLFFLHGSGANGKSTFIEALLGALGSDYATQAAPNLLMAKTFDAHPTEVADLCGKRFVATVEIGDGRKLAEVLVKQLTGGDTLKARRMREDFWHFRPTFTIFLAANHKPGITGTDHAIWRRILMVPFSVTIPADEQDKTLLEKLQAERAGILAWAVRGCMEWQKVGLAPPPEVLSATQEYREEMDSVGDFIRDRCTALPTLRTKASVLYNAYLAWHSLEEGGEAMTQTAFGRRLGERGYKNTRTGSGRFWVGLGLNAVPPPMAREPGEEG